MFPGSPQAALSRETAVSPPPRSWVWHSTLETRAAGKVSILACAETLFAVALYWWIAIRFDTHWHLVSSVFIAPLLLLRSPESIAAGVRWFLKDWFNMEGYKTWSKARRGFWLACVALVSAIVAYIAARLLGGGMLAGKAGWALFELSIVVGASSVFVTAALLAALVEFPGSGSDAGWVGFRVAVAVAGVVSVAGMVAVAGVIAGVIAGVTLGVIAGVIPGVIAGLIAGIYSIRPLAFRIAATLRYLLSGLTRVPENWRENNFLTDSFIPAELMPGIRSTDHDITMDGLVAAIQRKSEWRWKLLGLPVGIVCFLPAFLYRLNIKATAWFWWPLAYLLKPAPLTNAEGQEKQALCWPWTNPFQKVLILGIGPLVIASLVWHSFSFKEWHAMKSLNAVPPALKVLLAIDWSHIAPWHWALWIIEVLGLAMLFLAGNALSQDRNGNWQIYRQHHWKLKIGCMTALERIRTLATIALLLMALGALFIFHKEWHPHLPFPETWFKVMKAFYQM